MQKNTNLPRRIQARGARVNLAGADVLNESAVLASGDLEELRETARGQLLLVTNRPQVRIGRRWRNYSELDELATMGASTRPQLRNMRTAREVTEREAAAWVVKEFMPERLARHVPVIRRALTA
jgi:ribosomal protein S3